MAKYSHPHDEYYMTDNTAVNTEVISAQLGNKAGYIGAAAEVFVKSR